MILNVGQTINNMNFYISWKSTPLYKECGEDEARRIFKQVGIKILLMWEYYVVVLCGISLTYIVMGYLPMVNIYIVILKGLLIGGLCGIMFGASLTTLSYRYIIKNKLYIEKSAQQADAPEAASPPR